jgi:hypothetical protein
MYSLLGNAAVIVDEFHTLKIQRQAMHVSIDALTRSRVLQFLSVCNYVRDFHLTLQFLGKPELILKLFTAWNAEKVGSVPTPNTKKVITRALVLRLKRIRNLASIRRTHSIVTS